MSYVNATHLLPEAILELIQDYVQGETIYIPKKAEEKKSWGDNTTTKAEMQNRNQEIYERYCSGASSKELATEFFLSIKSIQRIVLNIKKENR